MIRKIIKKKLTEVNAIDFNINYSDWTMRNVRIHVNDLVTIVYIHNATYKEVYGRIKSISIKNNTESISFIEKLGETLCHGGAYYNYIFTVDISENFVSKTINIIGRDIFDIYLGEPGTVPPEEDPNKPSNEPPIDDGVNEPPIIIPLPKSEK